MRIVRVVGVALVLTLLCCAGMNAAGAEAKVYFLSRHEAEVVPELRDVPLTPEALITELLKGPGDRESLYSPFTPDTRLLGVRREGRTVVLDFNEGFLHSISGSGDQWVAPLLRHTLAQLPSIDAYRVTIYGRPTAEGPHIDFSMPMTLRFLDPELLEPDVGPDALPDPPHLYAVIDPGHGGSDPGASNWEVPDSILEKDVV